MLDFLASPAVLPFTVSLGIMFGFFVIELMTLFVGGNPLDAFIPDFEADMDLSTEAGVDVVATGLHDVGFSYILGWLHFGRVPVMLILSMFMAGFGVGGILMQHFSMTYFGFALTSLISIPLAFIVGILCVRYMGGILARIMPRDETSAISVKQFIGQVATITSGSARHDMSAEASLLDAHGLTHYLLVRPAPGEPIIAQGQQVLIIAQENEYFLALVPKQGEVV